MCYRTVFDEGRRMIICPKSILSEMTFPSDHEVIVGNKKVDFETKFQLETGLPMAIGTAEETDDELRIFVSPDAKVSDLAEASGRTLLRCLYDAADRVIENGTYLCGQMVKPVPEDETVFIMEAYGMQDALFYTCQDSNPAKTDENDMFDWFAGIYGYSWWMSVIGHKEAVKLLRYFFDRYLPIVKDVSN